MERRYSCLYSKHKTQKRKSFIDGICIISGNSKITIKDLTGTVVSTSYSQSLVSKIINEGLSEFELDLFTVELGEQLEESASTSDNSSALSPRFGQSSKKSVASNPTKGWANENGGPLRSFIAVALDDALGGTPPSSNRFRIQKAQQPSYIAQQPITPEPSNTTPNPVEMHQPPPSDPLPPFHYPPSLSYTSMGDSAHVQGSMYEQVWNQSCLSIAENNKSIISEAGVWVAELKAKEKERNDRGKSRANVSVTPRTCRSKQDLVNLF
ncbi:hypothetical protein BLNAU_7887 [Blattamonas nauphoetae]|uniref:5'-3' DNA helicase ZGRF1-like N-terminal domain-containing protein n=1 Tax=Blattamonas nauphoetae TaxID=2049346 RepID=A0ABQ9Y004_9EUKA|nr:hypothetical protein BLNAU_7887 [Blattamonas nauphoetae]